jgi:hypothetical protein
MLTRRHRFSRVLIPFVVLSTLSSCSQANKNSGVDLLSIPIESSEHVDLDDLTRRLHELIRAKKSTADLVSLVSELLAPSSYGQSVISIDKRRDDQFDVFSVILIADNVPDDDSVSGYRYDVKLKRESKGLLKILEARRSWRCWEDRGHRNFSVDACS